MGQAIQGGIKEHRELERFNASGTDIAAKDSIDLMARCWFSLSQSRMAPIEHVFDDPKTNQKGTVRITAGSEHGIATMHDQDLIIFAISQWVEAKQKGQHPTRRIFFTPYQFFDWLNIAPTGTAYARIREALQRLKTTNIETTVRSERTRTRRLRQFSWVSEWEMIIDQTTGRVSGVEVVLAEWLFESIEEFQVLTVDKRYFGISSTLERWLYLHARKATGSPSGKWKESFKSLYWKSASQGAYKHFANRLRAMARANTLPGFKLSIESSVKGKPMLVMERTEKNAAPVESKVEQQLLLIERTPLEEAWENALVTLREHLGAATVKAWLEGLGIIGHQDGKIVYRAPSKFVAEWIENHYAPKLILVWQSLGYDVNAVRFETGNGKKAA